MKKINLLIASAILVFAVQIQSAQAIQEEITLDTNTTKLFGQVKENEIYSLSNYGEDIKSSGAYIDVITRKDIEKQNSPSFSDLLQQQGSVYVNNSNGSDGSVSSVRMRGTDRVRFMTDGIRADRPSMTSSGMEPQFLNSDDIETIEIIRGPQGNVSGVNASGGVIALRTRRGKGPFSVEIGSEFGNNGSFKERFAFMGGNEKADYYTGLTFYKTDGGLWLSDLGKVKHDSFKTFNIVTNYGVRIFDNKADLRNIFRFSNSFKDNGLGYDNWIYQTILNSDSSYSQNIDIQEVLSFEHHPTDKYSYDIKFGLYHNRSNYYQDPDINNSDPYAQSTSEIASSRINLITQHNYKLFDWNTISLGYNLESEFIDAFTNTQESYSWMPEIISSYTDDYNGSTIQQDVYVNDVIDIKDKLFIRGGARLLSNSSYGTYVTPNASAALVLPTFKISGAKTKFRGSWGQSVNTPTLYQRFGKLTSAWGTTLPNPNLEAEHYMGWDAGIEQSFFNEKLSLDFGYFDSRYRDYITYEYGYPYSFYKNISNAKIHGYEAKITIKPNKKFKFIANYTYTKSEDGVTGQSLPACPENMVSGTFYYTPFERFTIFAGIDGVTQRALSSARNAIHTPGYVNAKLGGNIKLVSYKGLDVDFKGTIYNLFNQNICMYKSGNSYYYAPGIRFMAGVFVKYTFKDKDRV